MNKKQYLLLQAWASLAIVIITFTIFAIQKFSEIDEFGIIFGILFLLFFTYRSYSCFKAIKNVKEEERVYAPPTNASKTEILSYYKSVFYISIPAFIILSIWIYFDLKNLEAGNSESVRIWAPIALLYENGGFLLAVLTTPLLGIICWFLFWRKIKKTEESE